MSPSDSALISSLAESVQQLKSELRLLSAKISAPMSEEQWYSLDDAYPKLAMKSKRALMRRIESGSIPPDCIRSIPSSTKKTSTYVVNTARYLEKFASC